MFYRFSTTPAGRPGRTGRSIQAQQVQKALEASDPNSAYWHAQAMAAAQSAANLLGNTYSAIVNAFPDAWFEALTWKDQAARFGALLAAARRGQQDPGALVETFGA